MNWSWLGSERLLWLEETWAYPASLARQFVEMGLRAGLLLLIATLLAVFLRRDDATVRHHLWRISLIACLTLPVLGTIAPRWQIPVVPLEAVAPPMPMRTMPLEGDPLAPTPREQAARAADGEVAKILPPRLGLLDGDVGRAILVVWPAGAMVCLLWLIAGFVRLHLLARHSTASESHSRAARLLAARIGLRRTPRVRLSESVPAPIVFGLFRPLVLLPTVARAWSDERLRVVLLHELMHVRRHDGLFQLAGLLARAVYWPVPFAWTALASLARERELACDEQVIDCGERPSEYASHLLAVARQLHTPATAIAMAAPGRLEERVMSILRPERPRGTFAASVVITATLLLALPTLAGVNPWSSEEVTPIGADGRVDGWSDSYLRKELDFGSDLMRSRDWERVQAHYERVLQHVPNVPVAWFRLGYARTVLGDLEGGLEASREASRFVGWRSTALFNVACAYARLGDNESAVKAFELAVDSGLRLGAERVRKDEDLEALHGHPRFEAAVDRLQS